MTKENNSMDKKLMDILKSSERYSAFTLYDKSVLFKTTPLFSEKYEVIQVHDSTIIGETEICGFAGVCKVLNGEIRSLDGDSYSPDMTIIGYEEFKNNDGKLCLDVIADEW